jgi:hypothetical protein
MVNIVIKLLSGDILNLEISSDITHNQLYRKIYEKLPKDIRPKTIYMLIITRSSVYEESEYRDVLLSNDTLHPYEDEMFFVIIMNCCYKIIIRETINEYDYKVLKFIVIPIVINDRSSDNISKLHKDCFFYGKNSQTFYWAGKDLNFVYFPTAISLAEHMIGRIPNLTKNFRKYLIYKFLEDIDEYVVDYDN